jgi:HEAT repeat protein
VAALGKASRDPEVYVRITAVEALGRIGAQDDRVVGVLIDALGDREVTVRATAVTALGGMRAAAARAVKALATLLEGEELTLILIDALGKIGTQSAVDVLVEQLVERDYLRTEIAVALGGIGERASSALRALQEIAEDPDESQDARDAARSAMSRIRGE